MNDTDPSVGELRSQVPAFARVAPLSVHLCIAVAIIVSIVVGFSLAQSGDLRLNYYFGFRTDSSLVSVSAWNAAQKVGFEWLFWCGCPILIASAILALIGWYRNWSSIIMAVVYTAAWPVFIVILFLASAQGDAAARATAINSVISN